MTFLRISAGGIRRRGLAQFAVLLASTGIATAIGAPAHAALASAPAGVCMVPGQTWENVFTRVTPASGKAVHAGDQVGADYHDESQLNTTAPDQLQFTLSGPAGPINITPVITDLPPQTGGTNKEFKIVKRIRGTLPVSLTPGTYTAHLLGFDTDQTRPGADCGTASWTFRVVPAVLLGALDGDILLCGPGTPVRGGSIAVSGPVNEPSGASPVAYSQVPPGKYVLDAMAPPSYHFALCNGTRVTIVSPGAAKGSISVPANGSASLKFYVAANTRTIFTPRVGVQAAAVSLPNTGHSSVTRDALLGLILVLLGATLLFAVARSTRRV